jgi:hypothetical protein
MNTQTRIKQLEPTRGAGKIKKDYVCFLHPDCTEFEARPQAGWGNGETFKFKSREELYEFERTRTDINLLIVEYVYASEAINNGDG